LYYLHRINPAVPVEDVAHPMGKLIREEKFAVGANHNPPPTKFAGRMA
jgi:aryl-alcohol dehydrogenase-like predicted oxidoreductase